jgi:hypothetical protein
VSVFLLLGSIHFSVLSCWLVSFLGSVCLAAGSLAGQADNALSCSRFKESLVPWYSLFEVYSNIQMRVSSR